jgi:hypothetical protein
MNRIKHWPFEFVVHASREFVGRAWVRPGKDMHDEIEAAAAIHARVRGEEIDVIGCAVMPSGAIGARERIGVRIRP